MSNLVEYVKWSIHEDGEDVVHVGVLTKEDQASVTILTSYGELTIPRDDGFFEESTREEFEQVIVEVPEKEEQVVIVTKEGSKSEKALAIFQQLNVDGKQRKLIIDTFKSQLDMGSPGASTYYQNIKNKLNIK